MPKEIPTVRLVIHPFYMSHTNHLGNVGALSDKNGTYISGSLTLFGPFGNFRREPSTNPDITDHAFTGHKSNNTGSNDLGLIYMNAIYYLPNTNRFLTPDTIVPDPTNPQSFNRYSYVYNRPIVLRDPSGHDPMWCSAEYNGGSACAPLVSFHGGRDNWSEAEMTTIKMAAWKVAFALKGHGQANTASEQFLAVYGGSVVFLKTGESRRNLGFTKSRTLIHVNEAGATVTQEGGEWVAHELGHAFTKALYPNTTDNSEYGQPIIDLATADIGYTDEGGIYKQIAGGCNTGNYLTLCYESKPDGFANRDNPAGTPMEDIADMFSGYVYGFEVNKAGQARYAWMDRHMPGWVNLAVTNNNNR